MPRHCHPSDGRRAHLYALTAAHLGLPGLPTRLARACGHQFMPVWAHSPGVPHTEITGHTSWITAVAFGRAGNRDIIISASQDQTVRIWDTVTRASTVIDMLSNVSSVAISAEGHALCIGAGHCVCMFTTEVANASDR